MTRNNLLKFPIMMLAAVAALITAYAALALPAIAQDDMDMEMLRFDVAEDATRFIFDEAPIFDEDGMPAYGNSFVTSGYIYPQGTLDGSNGVLADGSPEFPDLVIGTWICRGFFIGDGAHTASGPWVITTQTYNFGDAYGAETLITEGYEISDIDTPISRAITGGTGMYRVARGQGQQVLLGFNATEGVNLSFELNVEDLAE